MTSSEKDATTNSEVTPAIAEVLMDFGSAVRAMRKGCRVARLSWGNPGKYVFHQAGEEMFDPETGKAATIKEHLVWKNDKGEFVPWSASQDAVLAEDWFIGKSGAYVPKEGTHTADQPCGDSGCTCHIKSSGDAAPEILTVTFQPKRAKWSGEIGEALIEALEYAANEWYEEHGGSDLVTGRVAVDLKTECSCIGLTHRFECRYHVPAH